MPRTANFFSRHADRNPLVALGLTVRLADYRTRIAAADLDVLALDPIREDLERELDPAVRGFHGFAGRDALRAMHSEVLDRQATYLTGERVPRRLPAVTTYL